MPPNSTPAAKACRLVHLTHAPHVLLPRRHVYDWRTPDFFSMPCGTPDVPPPAPAAKACGVFMWLTRRASVAVVGEENDELNCTAFANQVGRRTAAAEEREAGDELQASIGAVGDVRHTEPLFVGNVCHTAPLFAGQIVGVEDA